MTQVDVHTIRTKNGLLHYPIVQLVALIPGAIFLISMLWLSTSRGSGEVVFTLFDDAMISMTYAKTLAETGEWVWFPGAPRVQGFTNPLWTLILTLVHLTGLQGSSASFVVSIMGIALVLSTGFLVAVTVRTALARNTYKELSSTVAGATVPFLFPLAFWSIRGMEVGLLALLVTALALAVVRQQQGQPTRAWLPLATIAALLGVVTRLDFVVLGATGMAISFVWAANNTQRRAVVAWFALPLAALTILVLTFQYFYWGEWFPNTYTLKVEGFSTIERGVRGVLAAANVLPIMALTLTGFALSYRVRGDGQQRRIISALTLLFVVGVGYSVWTGGDAWEWSQMANRYESIVLPLAVAIVFIGTTWLASHPSEKIKKVGLVGLVSVPVLSLGYGLLTNVSSNLVDFHWRFAALAVAVTSGPALAVVIIARWTMRNKSQQRLRIFFGSIAVLTVATVGGVPMAMWWSTGGPLTREDADTTQWSSAVSAVTSPAAVVATVQAGAPGYYSHRRMIDLLGKSDPKVAASQPTLVPGNNHFYPGHNKWDYNYSIGEQQPDVVSQLWFASSQDEENMATWGYEWLCFGESHKAYFLMSSSNVDWSQVQSCPASSP